MNTIRNRILAVLILTGIIPLIVLFLLSESMIGTAIRRSEQEKISSINHQLAQHIGVIMESAAFDLRVLQSNPFITDSHFTNEEKKQEMQRLVGASDLFTDISLYDDTGFMILSTAEVHPKTRDYTSSFKEALNLQRIAVSRPHREVGKQGLFLSAYLPIMNPEKNGPSVIHARLSFKRIADLVLQVRPGTQGLTVLLDESGNLLASFSDETLFEKFDPETNSEYWGTSPGGIYKDPKGHSFLYAARILSPDQTRVNSPWTLIALQPMEEIEGILSHAQRILFVATAVTLLFAVLVGVVVADRFSRPIVALSSVARKVAEGDLSVRATRPASTELRDLAGSFNLMIAELSDHRDSLQSLVQSRTRSLMEYQAELERTSAHLTAALNSSNCGFAVESNDGSILMVNELFLDFFAARGRELAGRSGLEIRKLMLAGAENPDEISKIWESSRDTSAVVEKDIHLSNPDRRTLHVFSAPIRNSRAEIIGRVWSLRDLTEQKQLEVGLRQAQKMEAVGQLAGGVAHDFNNLLTGILGNLSLIDTEVQIPDPNLRSILKLAITSAERAAQLVKQLLGFSRQSHMNLGPCDANDLLREVRGIVGASIDPSVKIVTALEGDPWRVMADPNLLSQVLMNLAVNANDAMPEGGKVTFSTANHRVNETESRQYVDIPPGDYIQISVKDNGEGIPKSVQKRIFEPFFTTKEPGKGTGLGLATSFGIVKQLGGWIDFESAPGEGTRFNILLPRSTVAEAQPRKKSGVRSSPVSEAHETILVADDEPVVRNVAEALLTRLGYRVLVASDGMEALQVYEEHEDDISLVMLDLTMPKLSGKETYRLLRKRFTYVPVLICSGYLLDLKEFEEETGSCPDGFVQKPYRIEAMADSVREVLDVSKIAAA